MCDEQNIYYSLLSEMKMYPVKSTSTFGNLTSGISPAHQDYPQEMPTSQQESWQNTFFPAGLTAEFNAIL